MRDPIQCCSDYFTAAVLDACHRHEEGASSRTGRRAKARPGRGRTLPASLLSDLLREIAPRTRDAERMARAKLPVLPECFDARLLYGAAPEAFLAAGRPAEALSRAVEQLFFRRRRNSAMALAIAQGATLVMVASALGAGGPTHGEEALRGIEPGLRITLRKLLVKLGWSGEDGAFTEAGREFLYSDAVRDAVRHRPVLASLAAHPDVRLRVPMPDALRTSGGAFDRYLGRYHACIDDMLDLVASWRDPAGGARPSVAVFDAAGDSIASRALRSWQADAHGADGRAGSDIAFFAGEPLPPASVFASGPDSAPTRHVVVVAGNRPASPVGAVAPDAELHVLADEQPPCLDARGRLVDPVSLLTAWQEDLRAWAAVEACAVRLWLQPHASRMATAPDWVREAGSRTLEALAGGQCITAEALHCLAARVGLFDAGRAKRYPADSVVCDASLHAFVARDYRIRHALPGDLDRLCELESLCWRHTRSSASTIRARIEGHPAGQFVLERDGRVHGVVYSQRIDSADAVVGRTAADVHLLHRPDGPVVQLLAVNVDPDMQDQRYGDALLEFMLLRCSLTSGVRQVVGVTLCKRYDLRRGEAFERYIRRDGAERDPILTFHHMHGADIVGPVPGYRPEDIENECNGVLVSYDILKRDARLSARERDDAATTVARPGAIDVDALLPFIDAEAARLLEGDAAGYGRDRPFMEAGLDSAGLLKLQESIEIRLGTRLPTSFFFEFNTPRKAAAALVALAGPTDDGTAAPRTIRAQTSVGIPDDAASVSLPSMSPEASGISDNDIAIVGMACRLPGGIESPDALWTTLIGGDTCIERYPSSRGSWADPGRWPAIDRGGFVRDIEAFDAGFFRISPAEAQLMDPQQRMMLETAWACLEDGNLRPADLAGSATGVFVGASNSDYSRLLQDAGIEVEAHFGVASALSVIANRISYFFDLNGPSLIVDTACSSSLVALHTAIQSMRRGECEAALVGGVNAICHPDLSLAYHKAGMLAPDGLCKVFDARADGYVRSEGAVMFAIEPVHRARAHGRRIHAVIRGSAVNHGGLASGLTVPNPAQQRRLLLAAWKDAGIRADMLDYLEAHGTGTSLGDPIEVQGIVSAFAQDGDASSMPDCSLGSVKSNLGHLESAAGLAGLLKIVLSMRHGLLPPTVNFASLNPKIALAPGIRVLDRARRMTKASWIAGVSSFGSGGANAHIVVQAWPRPPVSSNAPGPHLFVLSAATPEALHDQARKALAWLDVDAGETAFADAIHAWQVGRTAMKVRLAMRVEDAEQLRSGLTQWLEGNAPQDHVWTGVSGTAATAQMRLWQTAAARVLLARAFAEGDLEQLGLLWTSGVDLDWAALHGKRPLQANLPTYPFSRERYWVPAAQGESRASVNAMRAQLHPLLHENVSDLGRQSYRSVFSGAEPFLSDHRVRIGETLERLLPGVAYLEMARAALSLAVPEPHRGGVLELRDCVWVQPLVVRGLEEARIDLDGALDGEIAYEVWTEVGGQRRVHCVGRAAHVAVETPAAQSLSTLRARMTSGGVTGASAYARFEALGLSYGPAHRALEEAWLGEGELLARLTLPEQLSREAGAYVLHPSLLDGALQAAVGLLSGDAGGRLPFSVERVRVHARCAGPAWAWVRRSAEAAAPGASRHDIDLFDGNGDLLVRLEGFVSRTLVATPSPEKGILSAIPAWRAVEGAGVAETWASRHVLLCGVSAAAPGTLRLRAMDVSVEVSPVPAGADAGARYAAHARTCFARLQAMMRAMPAGQVLLQVVAGPDDALCAGLSGMLKTAMLEQPQLRCQMMTDVASDWWPAAEAAARHSRLTVLRSGADGLEAEHWDVQPAWSGEVPPAFKEHGVYLITGGLGGLGTLFAEAILRGTHHARVVLSGRGEATGERAERLEALRTLGGDRVTYRPVDLEDARSVASLVAWVRRTQGCLHGVLHAAGMVSDAFVVKKDPATFARVLAPKVSGTVHLDEALGDGDIDFVVLFSSVVGAFGNVGQADYAAANGFMDHYALLRNARASRGEANGRTVSVSWPLWSAGGMGLSADVAEAFERSSGMAGLSTSHGLEALQRALSSGHARWTVMEGDAERLRGMLSRGLPGGETAVVAAPETMPEPLPMQQQTETDDDALRERLSDWLRRQFGAVLKLSSQRIDVRASLEQYGIDSILAMRLTGELEKSFGALSKTLLFEHRSIESLAEHLWSRHASTVRTLLTPKAAPATAAKTMAAQPAVTPAPTPTPASASRLSRTAVRVEPKRPQPETAEPIAVVGLSGRYPEAWDVATFWENLKTGRDCIVEVPADRWDWRDYYSTDRTQGGRHYSRWGGFIGGVDEFDPQFFNIAPREAKFIDPQERLFLQHAWMAVEDAGHTRESLRATNGFEHQVGVYVGVMYSEYQLFGLAADARELRMGFSGNIASIANRVSYVLDLHGPSMTVDTMCSSSLTAIHLACQDLRAGRTRMAIAGGVNVSVHPQKYLLLSVGQFISSDGHCQSFGEGGDGYIPGEGVGAVVLKRLSDAERDGDRIHGLIRGSALSHGGRTNGYTVPNPQAQTSAIVQALADAGVEARRISYVEAHGTGTKLGDPIEIAALGEAFGRSRADSGVCLIGSAKSNIGHCEAAAGIAGLTKVLLQLQHGEVVPSLHSSKLNPHIDFGQTAFEVNQTLRPWPVEEEAGRRLTRIAGLSSFGAGGSNAHLVVEEYLAPVSAPTATGPVLVVLSARTEAQLRQKARELSAFVRDRADVDLASLAYTLQVGREAMEERLALVVGGAATLVERLSAFADGAEDVEDLRVGQAKRHREVMTLFATDAALQEAVGRWLSEGRLEQVAGLWSKGLEVRWSQLYPGQSPRRMSLPAYPFARERHWLEVDVSAPAMATTSVLHPLLQQNLSDLYRQRYRSRFDGREAFAIAGALDGGVLMEMLRAAVARSLGARSDDAVQLQDVTWPGALPVPCTVDVEVTAQDDGTVHCAVVDASDDDAAEVAVHASAIGALVAAEQSVCDLADVQSRLATADGGGTYRGAGEVLRRVAMAGNAWSDHVLPQPWWQAALQAATLIDDDAIVDVIAVPEVWVHAPLPATGWAWVRATDASDVLSWTLCDEHGTVCVEAFVQTGQPTSAVSSADATVVDHQSRTVERTSIEGAGIASMPAAVELVVALLPPLRIAVASASAVEHTAVVDAIPPVTLQDASSPVESFAPARAKPTGIALAGLDGWVPAGDLHASVATQRPRFALSVPTAWSGETQAVTLSSRPAITTTSSTPVETAGTVEVHDLGEGVQSIRISTLSADGARNALTPALCVALVEAFAAASARAGLRAVVLEGTDETFAQGGAEACEAMLSSGLVQAIAACPVPVLAACAGDAVDAGWWLASLGDQLVASEDGRYGYGPGTLGLQASQASLMRARHGAAFMGRAARQVPWSGRAWRASGCAFAVVPREQLPSQVAQWTQSLSDKPGEALRLLKAHLTQAQRAAAMPAWPVAAAGEALGAEPQVLQIDGLATAELLRQFENALSSMAATGEYRGVVLWSASTPFDGVIDVESLLALSSRIADAPVPVVAALSSSAQGAAWAWSLGCDAAVYAEDHHYGLGEDLFADVRLAQDAAWTCPSRLGVSAGRELLLGGEPLTGAALSQRSGGAVLSAPADVVLSQAQSVCATLSANGSAAVSSWKRERAAWRDEVQSSQPAWTPEAEVAMAVPGPLALESTVVKATLQADGVLLIELQDHEAKNMFSPALVSGVREAFARVPESGCRVVVVTGMGRYFASGGTRESLLAIQSGEAKFTDYAIYGLPLQCEVPVIAAMQGHGIGAGWSLGMHADVVLHAEEGRYVSPYMSYGFTPGAGSTRMLPLWLGSDLARESLLGGREYAGHELRERGLQGVHARGEVLKEALSLAVSMARRPRSALVALKAQWATGLRDELERTYAQELAMHERTFVGQTQTRALIEAKFERLPVVPAAAAPSRTLDRMPVIAAASATVNAPSLSSVTSTLRRLLANELQMAESEVDADSQFVDLGLDSIIGVTWVRKLNEAYGLEIEATQVYAHPTLAQMARHVHAAVAKAQPAPVVSAADPVVASDEQTPTTSPAPQVSSAARVSFATRRPVVVRQAESPHMAAEAPPPAHAASSPALAPAVATESLSSVTSTLRRLLANELQMAESEVDVDSQFVDLGLDSIIGVTWVRKINEAYALEIEATQVYAHPTLAQMARQVHAAVVKAQPAVAADAPVPTPAPQAVDAAQPATLVAMRPRMPKLVRRPSASTRVSTPAAASPGLEDEIAVVGMAGQYPQARDLSQYWRNLAEGRDCIGEVPSSRWDIDRYYRPGAAEPGRTNSRWMGALEDYDRFDPLFFNISPKEAELMDPQQRLFLQTSWQAIEDAGYDTQSLSGSRCGVFAGCANGDYQQLSPDPRLTAQGFTGNANSILAGRIAYLLNLQGPCLSIDTACSSSLVAIAHACESLRAGTSDVALAGGVYVMSGPEMLIKTAQAGMLSPDGRCFTFDQRANGFVPGEGVGVVVLKRLSDARRDGDHVYGTVVGWGVNQDGKTNGITAPNPQAQTRLQREVYERFGIDPDRIGLLEAHGTGTKLGDPIEVEALKASFSGYTQREGYCALGSVKSNIGHTLTAAGVAGFQKLMLSLLHRQRPPTIQFERLNEHIGLAGSPFYVNRELRSWDAEAGGRRYAAVSSFGFGGTNAHVVVAESVAPAPAPSAAGPVLVVLSARTEAQLRQKARELSAFVRERPDTDLASLAYTLQVGREAMEERLAFVANNGQTVLETLDAYLGGVSGSAVMHAGNIGRSRHELALFADDDQLRLSLIERCASQGDLDRLAELWAKGLSMQWRLLYPGEPPRRMRLPTYPFARERYWLDPADSEIPVDSDASSTLHPLLHRNVSNLSGLKYESRFAGSEFFLADHQVALAGAIEKVLPGVAYLEMARAAFVDASQPTSGDAPIELRNVLWMAPFVAGQRDRIDIAITADRDDIARPDAADFTIGSIDGDRRTLHCVGRAALADASPSRSVDLDAIRAGLRLGTVDSDGLYRSLIAMGLHYGASHRTLVSAEVGDGELMARLQLPELRSRPDRGAYVLHPAMMDGAVQSVVALMMQASSLSSDPPVPFALDALRVVAACPDEAVVWLRRSDPEGFGQGHWTFDLDICDDTGVVCVEMRGFVLRAAGAAIVAGDSVIDVSAAQPAGPRAAIAEDDATAFFRQLVDAVAENRMSVEEALALS